VISTVVNLAADRTLHAGLGFCISRDAVWSRLCAILVFAVGLTCGEAAGASPQGTTPVLSGSEPGYPPFCIVTPENKADGFSVELLRAALKAMGCEVAFKTGPWAELKQELADGKLEVLPLVGRTPEREALFDFTIPYLTLHGALFIRRDTADIQTWEDVKDKRVAVMKGDNAEEYVRRVHLSDRILTSPSFEGAFQMLADGHADAVVAQKLMGISLLKHMGIASIQVVGRPSEEFTQTFSFAVRKGNGKLLATLNEGLAIVLAEGINWKLERKWMGSDTRETALARVLIYGGDSAFPPYEFLDEKGRPSGFNIELARAVARQMGVDISFQLAPWTEVRRKIENGELDLACMFYSASRARLVEFSVPHTRVYQAVFARKDSPPYRHVDDLKGRRISVQNRDIMQEYAVEHGLGDTLTVTATSEEALAALEKGRADYALGTYMQGLHWIKKNGWRNLRAVETRLLGTEYGYATPKGNTALRDLFNDGLMQVKETGEYRNIYNKWLGVLEPDFEWRRTAKIMLFVLVLAAFLAAIALGIIFTLRRQVRNRTRALQHEMKQRLQDQAKLHEAQRLAAIGTLACGMGHEINNPIMGIINYAQLIKDRLQGKNEALEEFAGEIVIEAERIAGIVRGLSAFATRDIATRVAVPVSDLVESALSGTRATLAHDHITLALDVPADLPAVLCDRRQIVEVLTGLLSNARDALNEKYPGSDENKIIVVSAKLESGEESSSFELRIPRSAFRIRLTVEDHGAGIPDAVREHIFEPFFTTKDKSVGAGNIGKGLGLFVSYATMQEHGGTLTVESEPGQWTRVHVELPVVPEPSKMTRNKDSKAT
jgi:ABC-type amino acid transport substrate-binding protein/nitrogen-specific signal transduction histidine kinase